MAAGYLTGVSPDSFCCMFGATNLMICAFVSPPSLFLLSLAKHNELTFSNLKYGHHISFREP